MIWISVVPKGVKLLLVSLSTQQRWMAALTFACLVSRLESDLNGSLGEPLGPRKFHLQSPGSVAEWSKALDLAEHLKVDVLLGSYNVFGDRNVDR